ncbi:MAG TPA: apolipoprotein N-acyltransferase [Candidatus Binatia bacterium]|nr:apolipoprotein N-acyltransferase [Candidatus Binatia bacterium]
MTAATWRTRLGALAAVIATAAAIALLARLDRRLLAVGWFALVPWLALLDRVTSVRAALAAGWLMCEAFVLIVFAWFPSAIQNYTTWPWWLAVAAVIAVAPLLQPQFLTVALARHLVRRRAGWLPVAFTGACIYVGTEWLCPKLFADTLGQTLYPSKLMRQAADLAGAHGLTFALFVVNECALATLRGFAGDASSRRAAWEPAACAVTLTLGLLAYGAVRVEQFDDATQPAGSLTVGAVQANISKYGQLAERMGTYDATRMILDTHFALSDRLRSQAEVDLLVWPETVYPTTFGTPKSEEGAAFDREIVGYIARTNIPLIFGAYDLDDGAEFNAAMILQPARDGKLFVEAYRKHWLFPLIERAPALLDSDAIRRWLPWLGTWNAGAGPQVIAVTVRSGRTIRVAPLICYDAIDPALPLTAVQQGADLLVTLSNDSWFNFGRVPRLILVLSAFRSIETRRPQVRVTNTGISAIISPTGAIVKRVGIDRRGTLLAPVTPAAPAMTLMLRWGDWFGPTALASGALSLVWLFMRRRAVCS